MSTFELGCEHHIHLYDRPNFIAITSLTFQENIPFYIINNIFIIRHECVFLIKLTSNQLVLMQA